MSVQVQYRRGTAVENNSFTGAYGEITVDTTNWTLRVQDGATAGGFSTVGLATTQTLTNKTLVAPSLQGTTTAAAISASGNITAPYIIGNVVGNISGNLTVPGANTQLLYNANGLAGASSNLTFNGTLLTINGTADATAFRGSGAQLTSLPGGNVSGAVPSATVAATVTTAAQPNITSVGVLSSLSVSGAVSSSGNVTAANITTSGTTVLGGLTLAGNTITGAGPTVTIDPNGSGGTDGVVVIAGNLQVLGNVTYIDSNVVTINDKLLVVANNSSTQSSADGSGIAVGPEGAAFATISYNSTSNTWVISNGANVSGTLTATGVVTGSSFAGSASGLTNIPGGNVTGAVSNAVTVTGAAQGNITSVGTLTSLSVSGNVAAGNISTTLMGVSSIINTNANGVGNIGNSTNYFNTVFAKSTSAQYADLAEVYAADDEYAPGTVVVFGGEQEITTTTLSHDPRVAGVISTDPAYLMNSGAQGLPVAFTGRVPTLVRGPVEKGDILVTSEIPGVAQRLVDWVPGVVIGKSLGSIDSQEIKSIEVVVGRF